MQTKANHAQHTPGPWKLEDRVIKSASGANVTGLVPSRMTKADISLISAAPDMLEGLEKVVDMLLAWKDPASIVYDRRGNYDSLLSSLEVTLRKAKGETEGGKKGEI